MKYRYHLIDPTKNMTALVVTPTTPALYPRVADAIMQKEPSCEQVGFVYLDAAGSPVLSMAGGEFCGNASMAAAALFCVNNGVLPGWSGTVTLTVSGASAPVPVQVSSQRKKLFACTVAMPLPEQIRTEHLSADGRAYAFPVVYFPGIAHAVLPANSLTREEAEAAVRRWCAQLGVQGLGLMFFDPEEDTLTPLVYIPAADTLFWERSCASGTTAVGAYLARTRGGHIVLSLKEPGGTLRVRAEKNSLLLSGTVELLAEREIDFFV